MSKLDGSFISGWKLNPQEKWKPKVSTDGSVSYIAEQGDTKETFAQQYGITPKDASTIVGSDPVEAGVTSVSGEDVAEVTGSEVLKLDLTAGKDIVTDQRKFDQFVFARDYTAANGNYSFTPSEFFSNYGYGMSGTANPDRADMIAQICNLCRYE